MKIAVITMAYNEQVNLPIWLRYYGGIFGVQNLYIIDHGSDDGSTDGITANMIRIPRQELDEDRRVKLVASIQKGLLEIFDWVIYTDTDEFLIPDPNKFRDLNQFLEQRYCDVIAPVGLNVIHNRHCEAPIVLSEKILRQRNFARFISDECKPLISRVPLSWTPGFHGSDAQTNVDPDLYLFHLKLVDFDMCISRLKITRERIAWSESAIRQTHSFHHRLTDDEFAGIFFPDSLFVEPKNKTTWEFSKELRFITMEPGRLLFGHAGEIVRIPERFRHII